MLANRSNTSLVPFCPSPFQMRAANAIRPPRARLVESINMTVPSTRKVLDEPSPCPVTRPDAARVAADPAEPPQPADPGEHGDHGGHVPGLTGSPSRVVSCLGAHACAIAHQAWRFFNVIYMA
ncbi:hypothetical protein PTMSG1_04563 [Pyrenophora teres f. maculata]|nr:hypothetical protein PTMSG1_04563 [Pyrenophora teres f. maculata]